MDIIKNLKAYFAKKEKNESTEVSPEGVCPNCWGHGEWDGDYYKFMKGEKGNPSENTYNTFIQEVARKLDKITIKEDSHTCETCKVNYEHS